VSDTKVVLPGMDRGFLFWESKPIYFYNLRHSREVTEVGRESIPLNVVLRLKISGTQRLVRRY